MKENRVKAAIRLHLSNLKKAVSFTNPCGVAFVGKPIFLSNRAVRVEQFRRIEYGLIKGSSDLIGWAPVQITREMVGSTMAVFMALETKKEDGVATPEQEHFIEQVKDSGGIAGIVRSVEDVDHVWEEWYKCRMKTAR